MLLGNSSNVCSHPGGAPKGQMPSRFGSHTRRTLTSVETKKNSEGPQEGPEGADIHIEEPEGKFPRPIAFYSDRERSAAMKNKVMGIRLGLVIDDLSNQCSVLCRNTKVDWQRFKTTHSKYTGDKLKISQIKPEERELKIKRPKTAPARLASCKRERNQKRPFSEQPRVPTVMFSEQPRIIKSFPDDSSSISCSSSDSEPDSDIIDRIRRENYDMKLVSFSSSDGEGDATTSGGTQDPARRPKSSLSFMEKLVSTMEIDTPKVKRKKKKKLRSRAENYFGTITTSAITRPPSVLIFDRAKKERQLKRQMMIERRERKRIKPKPPFDYTAAVEKEKEISCHIGDKVTAFTIELDRQKKISAYRDNYLSRYMTDEEVCRTLFPQGNKY